MDFILVTFDVSKFTKFIYFKYSQPEKRSLKSVIFDESKCDKSIDIIFTTLLS